MRHPFLPVRALTSSATWPGNPITGDWIILFSAVVDLTLKRTFVPMPSKYGKSEPVGMSRSAAQPQCNHKAFPVFTLISYPYYGRHYQLNFVSYNYIMSCYAFADIRPICKLKTIRFSCREKCPWWPVSFWKRSDDTIVASISGIMCFAGSSLFHCFRLSVPARNGEMVSVFCQYSLLKENAAKLHSLIKSVAILQALVILFWKLYIPYLSSPNWRTVV